MLFLYRPRQTWMPFTRPRANTDQAVYNRQLQEKFASTRRVAPPAPEKAQGGTVADLKELAELRRSGTLTEAEFEAAKAKLLSP